MDPLGRILSQVERELDEAIIEGNQRVKHKCYYCKCVVEENQIHQLGVLDVIFGQFSQITPDFNDSKKKERDGEETDHVRNLTNYAGPMYMSLLFFDRYRIIGEKLGSSEEGQRYDAVNDDSSQFNVSGPNILFSWQSLRFAETLDTS